MGSMHSPKAPSNWRSKYTPTREWSRDLGVVTLQMETQAVVEPPRIRLSPHSA
jgi:hypothetical protein